MVSKVHSFPSPLPNSQGGTGQEGAVKVVPFSDSLQTTGSNDFTSGTYATVTGSSKTVAFPTGTENVLMSFALSTFCNVAGTVLNVRMVVGSSNGGDIAFYHNYVLNHQSVSGFARFAGPFSGNQTVKLEMRRASGSGIVSLDVNDSITWTILGYY